MEDDRGSQFTWWPGRQHGYRRQVDFVGRQAARLQYAGLLCGQAGSTDGEHRNTSVAG